MDTSINKMVKKVTPRNEIKFRRKRLKEGYREPNGARWINDIFISESRRHAYVKWIKRVEL